MKAVVSFFKRFSHFSCSPVWFSFLPFVVAMFIAPDNIVYLSAGIAVLSLLGIELVLSFFNIFSGRIFPRWMGWANFVSMCGTFISFFVLTSGNNPYLPAHRMEYAQIMFVIGLVGLLALTTILGYKKFSSGRVEKQLA